MCSKESDCYKYNSDTNILTNECGDPNNYCVCGGTSGCISNSCTSDSDCSKISDTAVCNNGLCTGLACTNSSTCPKNMQCNGNVCVSIPCGNRNQCAEGSVCKNGYCVFADPLPMWLILLFIIITVMVAIFGYYMYKKHKAS